MSSTWGRSLGASNRGATRASRTAATCYSTSIVLARRFQPKSDYRLPPEAPPRHDGAARIRSLVTRLSRPVGRTAGRLNRERKEAADLLMSHQIGAGHFPGQHEKWFEPSGIGRLNRRRRNRRLVTRARSRGPKQTPKRKCR